jgi:high affinity sulfate transporter 1
MFRPQTIAADALAGVAVALVALPLSLAIANASGVPPKVGLVTAIVGGIAVALFGGCRLQVSGPAAAMTFLVSEIISKYNRIGEEEGLGPGYGLTMLVSATMLAGLFQLLAGYFRIGRFMQFIPRPVVAGFLSGIGVTILCTQLPKILGYDAPHDEEGGALGLLWSTLRHLDLTEWTSLAVGLTSAGLMVLVPKISRKLPTPLIAVATATALPLLMRWPEVATLGKLPTGFPVPHVPTVPWMFWNEMFMAALTIFFLASIESLLSASVVDSMVRQTRVDNDQELVGQGLGNVASALFGGIPVTGVIARSATNIQAGARTRLSAILHALMILAVMLVLGPLAERIPIPALAGVLCVVAVRMVEVHMIRALWRGSRAELAVYVLTAGAILVTDLIVGVPVGMIAAFFYVVYEMSTLEIRVLPSELPTDGQVAPEVGPECPEVRVLALEGPLFFASGFHLRNMLNKINGFRALVLDMTQVAFLDVTGAEILEEGVELMRRRGVVVVLCSDSSATRQRLRVLAEAQFEILRECPIAKDRTEALALAASHLSGDALCRECQPLGHCRVRTSADPSQSSYRGSGAA